VSIWEMTTRSFTSSCEHLGTAHVYLVRPILLNVFFTVPHNMTCVPHSRIKHDERRHTCDGDLAFNRKTFNFSYT